MDHIYLIELEVTDTTDTTARFASYIDLPIEIDSDDN